MVTSYQLIVASSPESRPIFGKGKMGTGSFSWKMGRKMGTGSFSGVEFFLLSPDFWV
jgi:hypothetical protein